MANKKGMFLNCTCNGTDSFTTKAGVLVHQLLVIVPDSKGVLAINLKTAPGVNDYPVGADLEIAVVPTFYNGRLSGLQKI